MSVDGCSGESDIDFDWEDGVGFTPPIAACWQGHLVVQQVEPLELQSPQERAAALFRQNAPQIEAAKAQIELEQYLFEKAQKWALAHLGYSGPCSPWFPVRDDERTTSFWSQKNVEFLYFAQEEEILGLSYRGPGFLEVLNTLLTPDMLLPGYHIEHAIYRPEDPPMVVRCSFKKFVKKSCHDIGKFWRKHKTEIIVDGIVLGIVVAVAILDPFAIGPAVAGGGALLDQLRNGDSPDHYQLSYESLNSPREPPAPLEEEKPLSNQEKWDQLLNSSYFTKRNIKPDPSYAPPSEFGHVFPPPPPPLPPEWASVTTSHPIESSPAFPHTEIPPNCFFTPEETKTLTGWMDQTLAYCKEKFLDSLEGLPTVEETGKHLQLERDKTLAYCKETIFGTSERLPTMGKSNKHLQILGINGIGTSKDEAINHQAYIQSLLPENCSVDFIYNHSNTPIIDVLEAAIFNHTGFSPNTADLLIKVWEEFHENNKDNPDKKFLQISHSQGSIDVYNALLRVSPEIANRIISVTIAPAKVIPKVACYDSFNYASKNDIIHYGEIMHAGFLDPSETGVAPRFEMILENREELIILESHQGTKLLDHGFQSLTYQPLLEKHLKDYDKRDGIYKKNE